MTDALTFDYTSRDLAGPRLWDAIRELRSHGPLVRVESNGGFWAATSHELVLRMAQDWQTFSSGQGITPQRPGPDVIPYTMPIDFDPPKQRAYRMQVNPHLTPKVVTVHEQSIRDIANELIDTFVADGSCDLAIDFARKFPGTVFFRLMVRCSDEDFRTVEPWTRVAIFDPDPKMRAEATAKIRGWAAGVLESRSRDPETRDLVHAIIHLPDAGESFTEHDLLTGLSILAQGGISTSANAISATMHMLCKDPDLQARVRNEPSLIPALIEEGLRLEPPIAMFFRTVTRDLEIEGCQVAKGDKVCLLFAAANRDPGVFERPDEVDIDRPHNRHLSFGAGAHRCVGSNLARLQIRVALEQLLSRLGPFQVPSGGELAYTSNLEHGVSSMPFEFAPAG